MNIKKINPNNLAEEEFGTGLLPQKEDKRDILFSSVAPFDWELGFDIELLLGYRAWCGSEEKFFGKEGRDGWGVTRYREIVDEIKQSKLSAMAGAIEIKSFKIPVKNQGASSSCTGQGLSTHISILNFIETGKWVEISARDIYAYIAIGEGGGAYLRDALKLACDRGISTEELVPNYHREIVNDREFITPYSEKEYLVKPEETEQVKAIRTALQGKEFKLIKDAISMDAMAWQMLMGFGTYFGVYGENNGTWNSEYPQPPQNPTWGHALYGGKAGLDTKDNLPFISDINSWGNGTGVDGWQKLKKNYFDNNSILSPWTYIDKENKSMANSNAKIIKDKNSASVGIWFPAISEDVLKSYCLNSGKEVPLKDGKIDWDTIVEGELILK